jgi:hypothetical protein
VSKANEHTTSPAVDHLVGLARRKLTGDAPKRNAASLEAVERALVARQARRRSSVRFTVAAGAMALVASVWFVNVSLSRPPSLKLEVDNGALTSSGHVDGAPQGTTLRFSDGTELALAPHARTHVTALGPDGAELGLERGKVKVHVTKRPESRWRIRAGAYLVNVTGTSFEVGFDAERGWLTLDLSTGSVAVSGPLIDGELEIVAGQHLLVRPEQGLVQVQRRDEPTGERVEPAPAPASPAVAADAPSDAGAAQGKAQQQVVARKVPKAVETWRQKVAAGHFDEVIALAERRGLSRVYGQGALEELQALADAARYVRNADVARPALLAIRKRFAASLAAHDAAFLLGRLEEDRGAPSDALELYDRYLGDQPSGVHASHALGRKLLIIHEQRGPEAALPIARQYLARFPDGPYAATAKKLAGTK